MKLMRLLTKAEWKEFEEVGPGVGMYRGLKTLFYDGGPLVYDEEERKSWQQIIILSRVNRTPSNAFKPILATFEQVYNGCEANIQEKLTSTASLPSNTTTNIVQTSDKVEASAQNTSTTEEMIPLDEMKENLSKESLSNTVANSTTKAVDFSAPKTSKLKEIPPLDEIVEYILTTSGDSDLQGHEINELNFSKISVDSLQTITKTNYFQKDHNTKNVHSTPHDNLQNTQNVASISFQHDEMQKQSTTIAADVSPLKRKYDEILNQQHEDDRLNEMKKVYKATITKKIQHLHEERQI